MPDPCCCLTGDYECDEQTFYHEEMRTARKEHKCRECRKTIKPGELYNRAAGANDGRMWSNKTCGTCDEIRKHFYCDGGWMFGQLWEDIHEQLFANEFRFECMKGLSTKARDVVLDDWRKWKGIA